MNNRLLQAFYGNEKAKATLALGWKGGRLPHAVLLEGESGAGKKTFARLIAAAAVCSGEERPCGVCRQVLSEFCDGEMPIICANRKGEYKMVSLDDLLPYAFSKKDMNL